jgi:integrase/recombinase XerD
VRELIGFTGLNDYVGLRAVVRSHIISWRKDMERRGLAPSSIRRKLSALSSLFDYLCERNAITGNPGPVRAFTARHGSDQRSFA